jgi:regulator of RNase E activity RraB
MFIDFHVAAPDEASAHAIATAALSLGYRVRVYDSPETDGGWTCECSTRMLATYEGVVAIQRELREISVEFGGYPDGWGTFGNKPGGQPLAV